MPGSHIKVLWDPQVFCWQLHGGISRVFAELFRELTLHDHDIDLAVPAWYGDSVFAAAVGMPQKPPIRLRGLKRALNRRFLKRAVRRHRPALVHPTFYEPQFLRYAPDVPFVLTVHDMIHERYAHSYLASAEIFRAKKSQLLASARRIIATSESTRQDLLELAGIEPDRIDVIYHGNSLRARDTAAGASARAAGRPYLLFVGHRTIYKNFTAFLQAVAPVMRRRDLDLLCVGGAGWSDDERALAASLGIGGRIRLTQLTDAELISVYQHAELFVFPSLYEGFGLPLLEAMGCRCPLAISDIPPFREVAADAAIYFDPEDQESMAATIDRVLEDSALRQQLITAGEVRSREFTWRRSATETAACYRRAVESA